MYFVIFFHLLSVPPRALAPWLGVRRRLAAILPQVPADPSTHVQASRSLLALAHAVEAAKGLPRSESELRQAPA